MSIDLPPLKKPQNKTQKNPKNNKITTKDNQKKPSDRLFSNSQNKIHKVTLLQESFHFFKLGMYIVN